MIDSMDFVLGDDYECDTCGFTYNRAVLYFGIDEDPTSWRFQVAVGCYGGYGVSYDEEDWEALLEEEFVFCRKFPNWFPENEKKVLKEIRKIERLR